MGQYYGIQRSDEFLAHYGVKGMRWGVRKAIEQGSSGLLDKHYAKASRKLRRLRTFGRVNEAAKWNTEMHKAFKGTIYDSSLDRQRVSSAIGNSKSKNLYAKAILAARKESQLNGERILHPLDDLFNGRRTRAFKEAQKQSMDAHGAYIDSLNKKKRRRYMNKIEVVG